MGREGRPPVARSLPIETASRGAATDSTARACGEKVGAGKRQSCSASASTVEKDSACEKGSDGLISERENSRTAAASPAVSAELRRLRAEHAELQWKLQAGPDPEAWAAWLQAAALEHDDVDHRLLTLKGRLMQEEWAIRRITQVLAKQQAALLALQGDSATETAVAPKALDEAITCGRALLDFGALADHRSVSALSAAAAKRLQAPAAALLDDLLALHWQFIKEDGVATSVRVAILALFDAGIILRGSSVGSVRSSLRSSASSMAGAAPPATPADAGTEGTPESCWRQLEEQCERRTARRALRKCWHEMQIFKERCTMELRLLEVECKGFPGK